MKSFKNPLIVTLILIMIIIGGIYGYLSYILPNGGKVEVLSIGLSKERVERGRYLAVALCMDCHSTRDWSKFSGPIVPGTLGMGGEEFNQKMGFPGNFYASNITPASLIKWSDGEILRAVTTGVSKDGRPLSPIMPYLAYGKMAIEDIYSIIAYIRTIKPIINEVKVSEPSFPFSLILRTIPQEANFGYLPDRKTDPVGLGAYLINAASCADCHTPVDDSGKGILGMEFAGGRTFKTPMGTIRSANISTDETTGIGSWTEESFVRRFKAYADTSYHSPLIGKGGVQTLMPWTRYAQFNTRDLKAIYAFLKTQNPVRNEVVKFEAAKN
ncbi:MAG: cytochrome C [Pelobium sp.]